MWYFCRNDIWSEHPGLRRRCARPRPSGRDGREVRYSRSRDTACRRAALVSEWSWSLRWCRLSDIFGRNVVRSAGPDLRRCSAHPRRFGDTLLTQPCGKCRRAACCVGWDFIVFRSRLRRACRGGRCSPPAGFRLRRRSRRSCRPSRACCPLPSAAASA